MIFSPFTLLSQSHSLSLSLSLSLSHTHTHTHRQTLSTEICFLRAFNSFLLFFSSLLSPCFCLCLYVYQYLSLSISLSLTHTHTHTHTLSTEICFLRAFNSFLFFFSSLLSFHSISASVCLSVHHYLYLCLSVSLSLSLSLVLSCRPHHTLIAYLFLKSFTTSYNFYCNLEFVIILLFFLLFPSSFLFFSFSF